VARAKQQSPEINAASFKGIDTARDIEQQMRMAPIAGACRVYIMDEAHQLTAPAQDALLKVLEDTPAHVYFFFCTTDPSKLKKTVVNRASHVKLQLLGPGDMARLIANVQRAEGLPLEQPVIDKIVELAAGSARQALVYLNTVAAIEGTQGQLNALASVEGSTAESIELARLLLKRAPFKACAEVLKKISDEPETTRRVVLGYMRTVLLSSGDNRAAQIIHFFAPHVYDSGAAGLALATYRVCNMESK
jgi:DNA polymerase III gamma/tau subunit